MNAGTKRAGPVVAGKKAGFVLLDHLRWLAAMEVVLAHAGDNFFGKPASYRDAGIYCRIIFGITGSARDAVIIFFVLSGFLVGGKALELARSPKLEGLWQSFLIDRVSRLFVVLWPVLLLAAICLFIAVHLAPDAPFISGSGWSASLSQPLIGDFSVLRWVGALFLLNNFSILTLQIDGPLWSLSYEWYYYLAALSAVLVIRRTFTPATLFLIGFTVVLTVLSRKFSPSMLPLGLTWVFGAMAREIFDRGWISSRRLFFAALMIASFAIAANVLGNFSLILVGAAVAFLIANRAWREWRFAAKQGKAIAEFSYSLYLSHFPLIVVIISVIWRLEKSRSRVPVTALSSLLWLGMVAVLAGCAWILSLGTEARTPAVRRVLLKIFVPLRPAPAPHPGGENGEFDESRVLPEPP